MYSAARVLNYKLNNRVGKYLQRWPDKPKILMFGPPNVPVTKLSQRLAIDLGVPVVNMKHEFKKVQKYAGQREEFNHPFFDKVKEILDSGDKDIISKEKLGLKLLRISEYTQEGFILNDFPSSVADAESLEEMDGGINAFLHINMPELFLAQLESNKYQCED